MNGCRFLSSTRVPQLIVAVLWLVTTVSAQVTSSIQGRMTDPSGAVVAGTSVKATNEPPEFRGPFNPRRRLLPRAGLAGRRNTKSGWNKAASKRSSEEVLTSLLRRH